MSDETKEQGEDHAPHLQEVEELLIHHTALPRTAVSDVLDAVIALFGKGISWLWLAVVAVIMVSVVSRYVFGSGSVMMEEIQWHIAGAVWLVGISYTLVADDHVRVDVLHEGFSLRTQAWVELLGILFLLLPFAAIALIEAYPYFMAALEQNERSQAPAGLPARWVLKFFLPLSFALIAVAGLSRLSKCTALLFGVPRPVNQTRS